MISELVRRTKGYLARYICMLYKVVDLDELLLAVNVRSFKNLNFVFHFFYLKEKIALLMIS